jgi:hypothetical protein
MDIDVQLTENEKLERDLIHDISGFTLDPYGFVMYAFPWGVEGTELEKFDGPMLWQTELLKEISSLLKQGKITKTEAIQMARASGHGIGKSALVSWLILWAISTAVDTKGVVTANTATQLKTKTWAELAKWYQLCIIKTWFHFTATSIYSVEKEHEKTWRIDMMPWSKENTEAFAGLHNKGKRLIIIMDEASAIPDPIWEVTEGALTDEDTEILWFAFGNPTRIQGRFFKCFNSLKHRWNHKRIDSRSVPITDKALIKKWEEDYGDDSDFFRVRVRGEFPRASTNQFISQALVDAARGKHLDLLQYNFAPVIIGVDRAWSGESETKIYVRQGLMSKKLGTFIKDEDDYLVAGHLARWEDEYDADAVFIDFGYGTGLFSAGKQMGRKWKLVPFGSASDDPMFANKRSQMWGGVKQWLKDGGSIPDDEDLCNDLVGPEAYSVQTGKNAGKLILESKDDMQKRDIASPDDGDALALTFAYPVKNKDQKQFQNLSEKQDDKFDILKVGPRQQVNRDFNPLSSLTDKVKNRSKSWLEMHTKH